MCVGAGNIMLYNLWVASLLLCGSEYVNVNKLESLGISVNYDPVANIYSIGGGGKNIIVSPYADIVLLNKKSRFIPGAVKLFDGSPYILKKLIGFLNPEYSNAGETKKVESGIIKRRDFRIVIDAGHGGKDRGTTGYRGTIIEKELNLSIALLVADKLESMGFTVLLTRDGDYFLKLDERVEFTKNMKADVFVSIHANHAGDSSVRGFEVYLSRDKDPCSLRLAGFFDENIKAKTDIPSRGIKRKDFYVIRNAHCPAVLLELEFLSNSVVASKFKDESYRRKIASVISSSVEKYYESIN